MQLVVEFGARKAGPVVVAIRQVLGESASDASGGRNPKMLASPVMKRWNE